MENLDQMFLYQHFDAVENRSAGPLIVVPQLKKWKFLNFEKQHFSLQPFGLKERGKLEANDRAYLRKFKATKKAFNIFEMISIFF